MNMEEKQNQNAVQPDNNVKIEPYIRKYSQIKNT